MNLKHLTAALTLAAASLTVDIAPALAQQQQQQQQQNQQQEQPAAVFRGDGLIVEIWGGGEKQNELVGYILMGQNAFPWLAQVNFDTGEMRGRFAVAKGEVYDFTATVSQALARMVFTTGNKTYNLVNDDVGQSQAQKPNVQNPLDQNINQPDNQQQQQQQQQQTPPQNNSGGPANNAVTPDFETGFNALQNGDPNLAYQHLEPLAMQGNVDAARVLGVVFHYGKMGFPVDGVAAAKFYEIAAKKNDIQSLGNLGYLYRDGIGVAVDGTKASDFFRRAAMLGDVTSQFAIGELYWFGEVVQQDDAEAIAWWIVAAENGNGLAQNNLAELRRTVDAGLLEKAETRAKELRNQIRQITGMNAQIQDQRTMNDIRNLAPGPKFEEIENAIGE